MLDKIEELESVAKQLEPSASKRSKIAWEAGAYIEGFLKDLPDMKGYTTGGTPRLESLEFDEEGKSVIELLEILREEVDGIGINTASGRHLGYIPGGGIWTSSLADLLAAATNRYAGIAYSNPGATRMEARIIRWLCTLVGYPGTAYGNIASGGSIANLTAITAARDHNGICSTNVRKSVIYYSGQVHHCVTKAFRITGLHEAVHRQVRLNGLFQIDPADLKRQVEEDIAAGLRPFLVVASAGTTDTGAIDPLDEIADICESHDIWFHVDAAYGGFFLLADSVKAKFKGIERSDSVVLDPHKTMFIPYGCGVVLVRNVEWLLNSFSHKAAYMQDSFEVEDINAADVSPELTKHFRALRMWLPMHLHGLKPFRANLEEKLLLTRYFQQEVAKLGFETGPEPQLSVAIFRYPGGNEVNQRIIDGIHSDGRVFMSSTSIDGELWIRCCVVAHRTHLREINIALEMLEDIVENLDQN